jgi:hypothetical protein
VTTVQLVVDCPQTLRTPAGRQKARSLNICYGKGSQQPAVSDTVSGNCGMITLQANEIPDTEEVYVLVYIYARSKTINLVSYDLFWKNTSSILEGSFPEYSTPNSTTVYSRYNFDPGGLGNVNMIIDYLYAFVDNSIVCIGLRPSVSFYNSW